MLEVIGYFSEKEMAFINVINEFLSKQLSLTGTVDNRGNFVRYEAYVGDPEDNKDFVLQFCVRDAEDIESGACNFVHISNIMIPYEYRRRGIATAIITIMSIVANQIVGIEFFITGIVNDDWKENLICKGGIEDSEGDIQIVHELWMEHWYSVYGNKETE